MPIYILQVRRNGYEIILDATKNRGQTCLERYGYTYIWDPTPDHFGDSFGYVMSKDVSASGASMFEISYPAVICIGVLATGVMGVPLTIADYRHRGILKDSK